MTESKTYEMSNPLIEFVKALARRQARIDAGLENKKPLSPMPPIAEQKRSPD